MKGIVNTDFEPAEKSSDVVHSTSTSASSLHLNTDNEDTTVRNTFLNGFNSSITSVRSNSCSESHNDFAKDNVNPSYYVDSDMHPNPSSQNYNNNHKYLSNNNNYHGNNIHNNNDNSKDNHGKNDLNHQGVGGQQPPNPPSTEDGVNGQRPLPVVRAWVALSLCLLFYQIAFMATIPVTAQYLSKRIGEDQYNFTNFTHQIPCSHYENDSSSTTTRKIQKEVSAISLLINYASSIPAIFTCLPYGTLSDHVGRKKILLFPLFGGFGRTLVYVFVVKFRLSLNYLYLGSAIDGLCGSYHATSMITASIVADLTLSASNRAISFAVIEFILIVSSSVSSLSVGYLIAWDGYFYPVLGMTSLVLAAIITVVLLLPETLHQKVEGIPGKKLSKNPFSHLKKIVSFYLFEGTRLRKRLFQVGMVIFFFNIIVSIGRSSVETLYQLNSPFCWRSEKIGDFR